MTPFITFEGGEGSGKTVQAKALYRKLHEQEIPALFVYEPGGTSLGKKIGHLLKWAHTTDMSPLSELLMFNASRAQLLHEVINPGLKEGKVVICDRYTDSTVAYQGYGRGLDLKTVNCINNTATGKLIPDLTILLDIPIEESLARKKDWAHDRFEQEALSFHQKVHEGYHALAKAEPERWMVVDARQSKRDIARIIWSKVNSLLGRSKIG